MSRVVFAVLMLLVAGPLHVAAEDLRSQAVDAHELVDHGLIDAPTPNAGLNTDDVFAAIAAREPGQNADEPNVASSSADESASSSESHPMVAEPTPARYKPPSEKMKLDNFLYDAFGPYPFMTTVLISAYHQARHTPPDWREGMAGYGMRYGSDFGTNAVVISTRYSLAEVLHQDTLYYRCACKGVWPRLAHAFASTIFARSGDDGTRVLAVPALVAPYAGTLVATEAWFPRRYSYKDALRGGNYGLMNLTIGNISLEFLPDLLHGRGNGWVDRFHLNNRHAARKGESAP